MDVFVDNYFSINTTDYNLDLPLQNAKYIIDILSPIIVFSLYNINPNINPEFLELNIHDKNNMSLSISGYEYYMQFIFYPKFQEYLKKISIKKDKECKNIFKSFYPEIKDHCDDCEIDYEKAKPYLKKYFNVTNDPRNILSMRKESNTISITKEPWFSFLLRKLKYCGRGRQLPGWRFKQNYYDKLKSMIMQLSVKLPTEKIHSYLLGKRDFNLKNI